MSSVADTDGESICCRLDALVDRLDVVNEAGADMELTERSFNRIKSLSDGVKEKYHTEVRF